METVKVPERKVSIGNVEDCEPLNVGQPKCEAGEPLYLDDEYLRSWAETEDVKESNLSETNKRKSNVSIKSKTGNTNNEAITAPNRKVKGSTTNNSRWVCSKDERVKSEGEDEQTLDDNFLRVWTEPEDIKVNYNSTEDNVLTEMELDNTSNAAPKRKVNKLTDITKEISRRPTSARVDGLIEPLLHDAPVSENDVSLCWFKCPICCQELKSWKKLKVHDYGNSRCHAKVSFLNVAQLITKTVCHVCKICSARVLCDGIFMRRHISVKHGMLLTQYIREFGLDSSNVETKCSSIYSNDVVGNLCVYTCEHCGLQFHSWYKFCRHQRKLSHGSVSYNKRHTIMKKTYHRCKICRKTILCAKSYLQRHFSRVHQINIKEYCNMTGCKVRKSKDVCILESLKQSPKADNLCVFACSTCKQNFFSLYTFSNHRFRTKHFLNPSQNIMDCLVSGFSYQCKICLKLLLCDRKVIQFHMKTKHDSMPDMQPLTLKELQYEKMSEKFKKDLPVSHNVHEKMIWNVSNVPIREITSTIGNLCDFLCIICGPNNLYNWKSLGVHMKSKHQQGLSYKSTLVHIARYHACLICPKAVLNDRAILTLHLCSHKMKLSKYESILCRNGGRSLPTFRQWLKNERAK